MTTITYVQPDGTETALEVDAATSAMRAAVIAGVPGIIGECGGQAMCATCHVYVRDEGVALPPIDEDEDEMLDSTAAERTGASRLSCRLRDLAVGSLTLEVPEHQL